MYEGGIRTPMLVRWPAKVKAGTTSDHISAFWDILPTFAEISGAAAPPDIDGISFLPTLLGKTQKQHEYLYWEFHEQGGKMAVRMDKWKAVKLNINKVPQGETELYDLSADPGETTNVASSNKDIVMKMEALMKEAHKPSEVFPFAYESTLK
jgi:arylsulfatase A-like enzyme